MSEHITVPVERIDADSDAPEGVDTKGSMELGEYDSKHYTAYVVATDKGIVVELSPKEEAELEHHGLVTLHVSLDHIISACGQLRRHEYFTALGKVDDKNPLGLESVELVEDAPQ